MYATLTTEVNFYEIVSRIINPPFNEVMNWRYSFHVEECKHVIKAVKKIFKKEVFCLELSMSTVIICGSLNGQIDSLRTLFYAKSLPPMSTYLFLGNYVNRGTTSLECIMLLLCLKIMHPNCVYLLRGMSETFLSSLLAGFRLELDERFGRRSYKLWRSFVNLFRHVIPISIQHL